MVSLPHTGPSCGSGAASWKLSVSSPIIGFGLRLRTGTPSQKIALPERHGRAAQMWLDFGHRQDAQLRLVMCLYIVYLVDIDRNMHQKLQIYCRGPHFGRCRPRWRSMVGPLRSISDYRSDLK